MKPDAIQRYISLMAEIKRRTLVIDSFSLGEMHAIYKATTVETIYLQFRKILELIAMGSLVANKEVFSKFHEKFSTCWNAKFIVNDIEKLNPRFYPQPIIQKPSNKPGIKTEFIKRDNYLTKKELMKLYEKCGAILHCENPYGSKIDYKYYSEKTLEWRNKIVNLLNAHEIRLVDDDNLYLIQMGSKDASPSYTPFAPIKTNGD